MTKENKWEGCPFDVVYHEKSLREIENGTRPDPYDGGRRYHSARICLAYEWLREKRAEDMLNGIYHY